MKKQEKNTDVYNVEQLKYAYQKGVEYLQVQQQFESFEKEIKRKITEYSKRIKTENQVFELTKKLQETTEKLQKMGKIDDAYEKYYQNKLSLPELENILQTKKECIDLTNQLKEATIKSAQMIETFKKQLATETGAEYESLKQKVIEKGLSTLVGNPKWRELETEAFDEDDCAIGQKSIEAFKKCFLKNSFNYLDEYTDIDNLAGCFEMIRQWFYCNDGFVPLHFENKKIVDGLPSPLEFYMSKLTSLFGKDFEKVTIVTNDFSEEYWKYDDCTDIGDVRTHHYVYVAKLLVPKEIAEKLKATEKEQTKETIKKLLEDNPEIVVLEAKNYDYGMSYYLNDKNGKIDYSNIQKPKWTEKLREEIRKKCNCGKSKQFKKSNNASICEPFGYFEGYHYYGSETPFVKVPDPKTATAIFETLEYVNKLTKLSQIKKLKDKKQALEDAEKECDELVKTL